MLNQTLLEIPFSKIGSKRLERDETVVARYEVHLVQTLLDNTHIVIIHTRSLGANLLVSGIIAFVIRRKQNQFLLVLDYV